MITILALLIGIAIFCGGVYYFAKEKADPESRTIYRITIVVGAVIAIGAVVKIALSGL